MAAFKDKLGREWLLDLTKGDVRRVEKALSVPFGELLLDWKRLAADVLREPDQFYRLLWCLLEPQARAAGVDQDSFDDGYGGATEDAAALAFAEAVVDFSPARKVKGELMAAFRAAEEAATAAARARLADRLADPPPTRTGSASSSPPSAGSTATG